MKNWLKKKIVKKLSSEGSVVAIQFVLYINNDEPCIFDSESAVKEFISSYLAVNQIFNVNIYRIVTSNLINL